MRNIMSFGPLKEFSGLEIKNWAQYHYERKRSHYKEAKRIISRYYNLRDDRMYRIVQTRIGGRDGPYSTKVRKLPMIAKASLVQGSN